MPERARWHHYIPQFHLKLFADPADSRFIYEHDKRDDKTKRRGIRSVAARQDFYTMRGSDGAPTDVLERAFGPLESNVAPVLRKLADHPVALLDPTVEERALLGAYVALEWARVPSELEQNRQIAEYMDSVAMDMIYATSEHYRDFNRGHGSTATDEELEAERIVGLEQLRSGAWRVPNAHELALTSISTAVETIGPVVAAMNWTLLRRTRPPWFVLGDTPVRLFKEHPQPHLGVGFATDGTEVHMPLSSTHFLIATFMENWLIGRVVDADSEEIANGLNAGTFAHALRSVFGESTETIHRARRATPEAARTYREPIAHIGGGPEEWERYKPGHG